MWSVGIALGEKGCGSTGRLVRNSISVSTPKCSATDGADERADFIDEFMVRYWI